MLSPSLINKSLIGCHWTIGFISTREVIFDIFVFDLVKLIKIHSPMRADPNRVLNWVPSRSAISAARIASEKLLR